MDKIIMVCTGNTCRSPMAEALMRRALMDRGIEGIVVESAGTFARSGDLPSHEAVAEMRQRGLDIQGHRSERLDRRDATGALVLCMTRRHLSEVLRVFPHAEADTLMGYVRLGGDIEDPVGMGRRAYRDAADTMERAIGIIADGIAQSKGR